jgi:hypothetical protein
VPAVKRLAGQADLGVDGIGRGRSGWERAGGKGQLTAYPPDRVADEVPEGAGMRVTRGPKH